MIVSLLLVLCLAATLFGASAGNGQSVRQRQQFSEASLNGCFGVREQGDGSVAVGLGTVCYDGQGNTKRSLKVNAPDGQGGRRLLQFESRGTYTVEPDGKGTSTYINVVPAPTTDTFDLIITGTESPSPWSQGRSPIATEVFGAQREAGLTVSLVTSLQKRISDYQ